jgi:hypothetical protein
MVCLEMMAPILGAAEGETFEVHHDHLGGFHILPTVAHNLEILGLHWHLLDK